MATLGEGIIIGVILGIALASWVWTRKDRAANAAIDDDVTKQI